MAIYVGTQKVKVEGLSRFGVGKVYVGDNLVWDKNSTTTYTITYRKAMRTSTTPASIQVPAGYELTSADLPTGSDGNNVTIQGWTLDGTNMISAGYVVNSDITLLCVQKYTKTSSNLFKSAKNYTSGYNVTVSVNGGNVGNSTGGANTSMTYELTKSYTTPNRATMSYYIYGQLGAWGGLVCDFDIDNDCRIEWTPSRKSVTFTSSMAQGTNSYNYTDTWPTMVIRDSLTGLLLYTYGQNSTSKITYTLSGINPLRGPAPHVYIQHGGNYNGNKYASRADYMNANNTTFAYGITCNASTATENIYLYTSPVS